VTADNASRVYGAVNPVLTGRVEGLQNGDNITGVYSTGADTNSGVGSYPISVGLLDPEGKLGNYSVITNNGTLTITPANSTLDLVSSLNPSGEGSNVTFTATASPVTPTSSTPTGSVQFYTNDTVFGSPVTLADGIATLSTADLPVGTNTVRAAYLGDGNFIGSTNSLAQVVNFTAEPPSTVAIQANPDGTVTVTFAGTPGAEYRVQACNDLTALIWQNVSTNIAGADGRWTFTESVSSLPERYYRSAMP
jgi:hypothetical protein